MFEGVSSELPLRVARSMVLTHALDILGMLRVICFAVSFDLHMLLQLKVGELGGAATWCKWRINYDGGANSLRWRCYVGGAWANRIKHKKVLLQCCIISRFDTL